MAIVRILLGTVRLVSLCALLLGSFFSGVTMADENKMIIAHRGASGYLPEHTLAAKAMAYGMGADFLEQDVVLSKDGVPIILHDIHIDTVSDVAIKFPDRKRANGRYFAIDFTLEEIQSLRANERIGRGGGPAFAARFPMGKSSFQIPTLAQEIELVQGLNKSTGRNVGIYPEIKAPAFHKKYGFDLSKIVIELLAEYGYKTKDDAVILQCFDWDETRRIRNELGYKGRLVQLIGEDRWKIAPDTNYERLKSADGLKQISDVADGIGPWINQIVIGVDEMGKPKFSTLIDDAHAAGLKVHPYTARADALPSWATDFDAVLKTILIDANADGIFTDFTDKAVSFLKKR